MLSNKNIKLNMFLATVILLGLSFGISGCGNSNGHSGEENVIVEDYSEADSVQDVLPDENDSFEVDAESKAINDGYLEIEDIEQDKDTTFINEKLDSMTLEEKVAQMFIIFPESLVEGVDCVSVAGEATKSSIDNIPVGGIVYLGQNIKTPEQVKDMLDNTQQYSMDRIGIPMFLCVDEEGGKIARIANNRSFGVENVGDMWKIGEINDPDNAYIIGNTIGAYLSELGFNLDFSPDADVMGEKYNYVIGRRAFSDDPDIVSDMALAVSRGLNAKGVISVYKHFPGHGSTTGDPHKGYAYTEKSLDELKTCDLIPFKKAIENDVPFIMVGHISLPNILNDDTPASLSEDIVRGLLRDDMGYEGVIITDAMNMGAVSDRYESDVAAVTAVKAGVDIILMPKDFKAAYEGVLKAVKNGEIQEERIDESVRRIIKIKHQWLKEIDR